MKGSPLVRRATRGAGALISVFVIAALSLQAQQPAEHWVGTWATAQVGRPQSPPPAPPGAAPAAPFVHFSDQTLRQVARISVGGPRVRVVLSNVFGTAPLTIGAAHVALRDREAVIVSGSSRALTFSGQPSITIPAGAIIFSDAVNLTVAPLADVAVDLFLPGSTNAASPLTMHNVGLQTSYISGPGNHAGKIDFPTASTAQNSFVLSRIEVTAPSHVGAVVAFGDSITDGTRSTPDTNNRWPNHLARRLMASPTSPMGVLNAGISGNRLLSEAGFGAGVNALARFDRQALGQTGITHVIVMEGINDIGTARDNASPSADEVIAAHRQLIAQAHARGITAIGATLTPFEGAAYFTQTGEAKRQAVNRWIRTSNEYDGVIDFDAVIRDPAHPARALPQYDSGDHLHPNDAGYRAMGEAVDLALFARNRTAAVSSR
jgi:lysophospholipase L1-like esterase